MTRRWFSALALRSGALALVAVFLALAAPSAALALDPGAPAALESLTLVTGVAAGQPVDHILQVEVMRTDAEHERGLMERRYMPADRGMLFEFAREQTVLMWMKNTFLPLDMIFISPKGVVTHIAENAEPMSEAIISSEGPVVGVLEVNAGLARKIGLKPGDLVRHGFFIR
jgi:uncharacterized protein